VRAKGIRLALTAEEMRAILYALTEFRNKRLAEGKTVDFVDEVILKFAR